MYVLGIDGGGTKTTGVMVDLDGHIMAIESVGPTNPQSMDERTLRAEFERLFHRFKQIDAVAFERISAVFTGVAGVGRKIDQDKIEQMITPLINQQAKIWVDQDALNALYSGTLGEPGVVNIAGTGSITFGINDRGERKRVGGWGYLLGDPGSGYSIGREALAAILSANDGCGRDTRLTDLILDHFNAKTPQEIIRTIYEPGKARSVIAPISKLVTQAADQDDQVAKHILEQAGSEMAHAIGCLLQQLYFNNDSSDSHGSKSAPISVVLTGGLYQRKDWFLPTIEKYLQCNVHATIDIKVPDLPPVAGAVIGCWSRLGIPLSSEQVTHLKGGLK